MGRASNRRKLSYKPVIIVAAVAFPVLALMAWALWPRPEEKLVFEKGPDFAAVLSEHGTFHVGGATNAEAHSMLFYRFEPGQSYRTIASGPAREHRVAGPGRAGQQVEFHVEASGLRQTIDSDVYRVTLEVPPASQAAGP